MNRIYTLLPKYAWLPIAVSLVLNGLVYFGSRLLTAGLYHYDFSIIIDEWVPFVPAWMAVYVLAYVTWVIGFVVIGRESPEVCYETLAAEQVAKLLCLVCFIAIPSTLVRPTSMGAGFFGWLTDLMYRIDSPDNLFPSIHCLESWICFRGALRCRKTGKGYKIGMLVAALLVFASTLFVKQHVFVDVIGGIAVVEIGLFLSRRLGLSAVYRKLIRE